MKPLLSVLMTSFNREQFITEAMESVLISNYDHLELIIVDDGSTDKTVEIARSYAKTDSRIRVYVNQQNLGDYPNRNRAASYAIGEFLMFVDSDDKILKDGFAHCITAMEKFPEAGMGMLLKSKKAEPFYLSAEEVIKRHFFHDPCLMIGPGGTILRRTFFEAIGGYPVKYGPANDMYFNLKAAAKGGIVFLPFVFNFYRIHNGQEINNRYSYLYNNYRYLQDALKELPLPLRVEEREWISNKNKRRFLVNLTQYLLRTRNLRNAAKARRLAGFSWKDVWKALLHPSL
jgi:glycosyltransferase involved in cell wall biosynthesis